MTRAEQIELSLQKLEDVFHEMEERIDDLKTALEWYEKLFGEWNRGGPEGDGARNALAQDLGHRAHAALKEDRDDVYRSS